MTDDRLTRVLGWASVGLGPPLLLAPVRSARALGIEDGPRPRAILAGVGVRELTAAAGLLGQRSPRWLWSRVAGDLIDLALLGYALRSSRRARGPQAVLERGGDTGRGRTAAATAAVAVITAVDVYAATSRAGRARRESAVSVTATVTVTRPRQEVYGRWRRFDAMPAHMTHLGSVTVTGPRSGRWPASAPFGRPVEWDAQITDDVPGERIAWRSVDGSKVRTGGDVRFDPAPDDWGTEVCVTLRYAQPGGRRGRALARYFGQDPRQRLDDDLRRFKQVLEDGQQVAAGGRTCRTVCGRMSRPAIAGRPGHRIRPGRTGRGS